ncbi:cAMP-responsive element modulator-like isoform 1-T1 [Synchiropus picturatus]
MSSVNMDNAVNPSSGHVHYYDDLGHYRDNCPLQTLPGAASDMSSYQLRNTLSRLQRVVVQASDPMYKKLTQDSLQKKALRLMKNRWKAGRECRQRKKEYLMRLENRVADLEKQNQALLEELHALRGSQGNSETVIVE